MKKHIFLVINILLINTISFSQNIGIGTTAPLARLHVADSSVVFTATGDIPVTAGNPPVETAGRRMMWYPDKAAFRVGYTNSNFNNLWTRDNIGNYSFATGISTNASGLAAFATGYTSEASGSYSVAMGYSSASGFEATAAGSSTASGVQSVALGGANASGPHAVALGYFTTSSGDNSVAIGYRTTASNNYSFAIGANATASGTNSIALGNYISTSGFNGALTIGDNSTTTIMQSFVANGYRSRFAGGYRLLTNSAATLGVVLLPDGGSWSAISDVRLKENFLPVNAETILKKIATLPLSTWNYKEQSSKASRHYGPMAQDFFKAFGHDDLGEIGCDTLINQQDFLGVNLIAIQALEKRTTELSNRLEKALELINRQAKEIDLLKEQYKKILIINK